MKIETKYNIGQEVWWYNEVYQYSRKGTIETIQTNSTGENTRIHYFLANIPSWFNESELFPNKRELLNSIKK